MKIMFNLLNLRKGGAERVIANLSNYLINDNEISIVTTLKDKIEYNIDNKIMVSCVSDKEEKRNSFISKLISVVSLKKIYRLKKIINEEKPDIIIAFLPEPCFRILLLKKISKNIKKIPVIISVRNDPKVEYKNKIINIIMRKLYPIANGIVFQTQEAKSYFSKFIKNDIEIIANPISKEFIKERYIGDREKRIVTVGRLEPQKNHELLIESFREIYDKHPDYSLEIYGKGSREKQLKELVNNLNITNAVKFMGVTDNVKEAIYNAKAFVLSSKYEGMPNALLEAFVLGVPCISTDCPCGGAKTIIKNNDTGILVDCYNKEQLVSAINKIIETDVGDKYGENANKQKETYTIENIANEWKKFIFKIIRRDN